MSFLFLKEMFGDLLSSFSAFLPFVGVLLLKFPLFSLSSICISLSFYRSRTGFNDFFVSSCSSLWLKASSQLILSSSQISRQRRMKSFDFSDIQGEKATFLWQMPLMSSISFWAGQGVLPCSISQQIRPMDHRSDLAVYLAFLSICGDMYRGVPTMDFMTVSSLLRLLANPKSLSLQTPFFMRMLAGLRSRWMMPFLCRYLAPFMMSLRQALASLSSSLFFFWRRRKRSPSWHSYVTMYMLLEVWQMSQSLTMLSWETFFMISISDWMFLTLQALEKIFLSMTLTATGSCVSISLPRQTAAQEP